MKYNQEKAKKIAIENENKAKELLKEVRESYHTNPEAIAEMFAFSSNFYSYSPRNTQLIYAQNPNATYCQSFKAWKDMDASVKSGEHGYKVWVPVKSTLLEVEKGRFVKLSEATKEQKEAYQAGRIEGHTQNHFKIGTVFDISQTTFPKERYPELFSMGFSSEEHSLIYEASREWSQDVLHCPIVEEDVQSISLRGFYTPAKRAITMNQLLEDSGKLSTALHEIGHAMLEHSVTNDSSVAQKEVEADAIAIMMQSTVGIPLADSRKRHFADHYKRLEQELMKDQEPEVARQMMDKKIDEIFDHVYRTYRDHIESFQEYLDRKLPREAHIAKEVSMQQKEAVPKTATERAMKRRAELTRSRTTKQKGIEL